MPQGQPLPRSSTSPRPDPHAAETTDGSGEFTPITWDDAIAEIGERFRSIIAHSGPAAISYSFDGTQGVIQKGILARRFFAALGPPMCGDISAA